MPTKADLREFLLRDTGMVRTQDPDTQRFSVEDNAVDKTPLMLYTEQVTGMPIKIILLKQMSTRRLAEWITHTIGRRVTQATICKWRQHYSIIRRRRN